MRIRVGDLVDDFFAPNAVAVVGASGRPGKIGYEVLRTLVRSAFKGGVYPVNPAHAGGELLGKRCYAALSELPERPRLAVLVVGAGSVPQAMEECAAAGVRAVVIISGGFKELGKEGGELERRSVEIARSRGMRVIGPNCIGISSSQSGLETFFQPLEMMARPGPGPIAILSQSGTFGATLLEWFAEDGLGVSKFASYGNGSDVDELDLLEYLMRDPATGLMVFYVEGLGRAREFADMAAVAGPSKPVLMLKGGRTGAGAAAASSHTGSIAGRGETFEGAMAQCGVVLARDSEELFDLAKLFALQREPAGGRVAMVTNGAGPCVVAADIISASRWLSLARLSEEGAATLRERLPPYNVVGNPVDLTGSADALSYRTALEVMAADPGSDILMSVFVFQDAPLGLSADELVPVMEKANGMGKTVLAVAGGGPFTRRQSMRLQKANVPVFPTAGRALAALEGLVRHSRWKAAHHKVE